MDFALSQFDIMGRIGQEVNNVRETEKNKEIYNIVIKHLTEYLDEFQKYPMNEGAERAKDSDFTYAEYLDELSCLSDDQPAINEDQFNEAMAGQNSRNRWKTEPWGCLPSKGFNMPDLRCDTRFLEYNNLYNKYLLTILKSHNMNEDEYNEWCDDYF
jgi:hypothetical protein